MAQENKANMEDKPSLEEEANLDNKPNSNEKIDMTDKTDNSMENTDDIKTDTSMDNKGNCDGDTKTDNTTKNNEDSIGDTISAKTEVNSGNSANKNSNADAFVKPTFPAPLPPKKTTKTNTNGSIGKSTSSETTGTTKGTAPPPQKQPEDDAVLKYSEPKWSGAASFPYTLEVLKGGQIIDEVDISERAVVTVGRLPSCDVPCLHPSISRYHALFQHRSTSDEKANEGGVFLYDLESSYGTVINKVKIKPRTYYMLKTGYVIKFGASTRLYIVKGPPAEADEDEQDMIPVPVAPQVPAGTDSRTKLGIMAAEDAEKFLALVNERKREKDPSGDKDEGINWGFREDAPEEELGDGELKLDVSLLAKPADFKDPKKTLRGYFEREGVELEYVVTETGLGKNHMYLCKVELPLDTPAPVVAEGTSCGKKKDAVLACALHGCRLLDAYGVLRSNSRRYEDIETRMEHLKKNDFYDSDEDTFTDRTGEIENKRKRRMLRAGVEERKVQKSRTYDMLSAQLQEMNTEIASLETKIKENKAAKEAAASAHEDELDAYMATVSENTVDTGALREAKKRLFDLKQERVKLERLCELSKPVSLPQAKKLSAIPSNICTGKVGTASRGISAQHKQHKTSTTSDTALKKIKIDLMKPKLPIQIQSDLEKELKSESSIVSDSVYKPAKSEQTMETKDIEQSKIQPIAPPEPISEFISEPNTIISIENDEHMTEPTDLYTDELNPTSTDEPTPMSTDEPMVSNVKEPPLSATPTPAPVISPKNKKKKKGATMSATLSDNVTWDTEHDENFVNWTPPTGQTGDGRTKLNDKFGY